MKEKKNLRLSSARIKKRMDELDTTFKHWKFEYIDCTKLKQLTGDIEQIEGELFYILYLCSQFIYTKLLNVNLSADLYF